MQFREQGKKIQCIRSTYDPATKRSHQKVVASFNRWADSLPSDGLEGLTEAERAELVPARQQFRIGRADEAADVVARQRLTRQPQAEQRRAPYDRPVPPVTVHARVERGRAEQRRGQRHAGPDRRLHGGAAGEGRHAR